VLITSRIAGERRFIDFVNFGVTGEVGFGISCFFRSCRDMFFCMTGVLHVLHVTNSDLPITRADEVSRVTLTERCRGSVADGRHRATCDA